MSAPAATAEAVVDGARTALHEFGDPGAPPLLALHGLRGSHHGLAPMASRIRGARVVVPDLPGFGASPAFGDRTHDVEGYARWASALLDELGPEASLLGHSFGSIVAARIAVDRRSAPPRRLVLVNPIAEPADGASGITRIGTELTALLHETAARRGWEGVLRHRLLADAATASMTTTRDAGVRHFVATEHRTHFGTFATTTSLIESFRAASAGSVLPWAADLRVPTLLLAGAKDRVAPLPGQERLAAAIPAEHRLAVLPGVGHLVHYEAPAWAAREIEAFLA
ncbi:alpha/beta fold hydrolase [Pseudonocardia phyllosphaerae]|uniref:alpha/beta fold hydrolase n=1 Tax=Pseudonocardia phyllosphaerae TaxID=3390502 RepID=UPI00397AB143